MTPLAFNFLLICTLLATVSGQQSIVSTNTITSGGTFSVYCDASRAATPGNVHSVDKLFVYRMVATDRNYSLIAQYNSINPPGFPSDVKNIPIGRSWNITFSGANNGDNNIATMKIVIDVNDAMCRDAGMYRCQIYYYGTGTVIATAPDQNVTASTGLSNLGITDPQDGDRFNQGDNVTFTCTVTGPGDGVYLRWELWVVDNSGNQLPQNLPANNEIVNSPATPKPGSTGCPQFDWVSTLTVLVPADNQQIYKCFVSYSYTQKEESSNVTIGITGVAITPCMESNGEPEGAASTGPGPDVGMIVGIVIGCLVAIIIVIGIIFFMLRRKRSKKSARLSNLTLTADPSLSEFNNGDNVTFTCSVSGPITSVNFRWELWVENDLGIQRHPNITNNNPVVNSPPTPKTGNPGCAQINWVSTLNIQVSAVYTKQTYKCAVTYMQQEESGNLTIRLTRNGCDVYQFTGRSVPLCLKSLATKNIVSWASIHVFCLYLLCFLLIL